MQSNHYFIGIHVPDEQRSKLTREQDELRSHFQYKNWTGAADFHITLKFLGAVTEATLEKVISSLKETQLPEQFVCELKGLGYFGNSNGPRVLIREAEKHKNLLALQTAVEELTERYGYPREKRGYTPHVTLAKKFISTDGIVSDILGAIPIEHMCFCVNKVTLFRIEPQNEPRYVTVAEFQLRGGEDDGTADQA